MFIVCPFLFSSLGGPRHYYMNGRHPWTCCNQIINTFIRPVAMPKKKFRVRHRMNAQNSKGNRKRRRFENASSLPSAPLVFNIPRFSDTANDAVTTTQPLPVSQQEGKETTLKSATSYNTDTIMSYRGYTLKKAGEPIDYICPATITPKEFFDKYVKRRRPVVLSSSLDRIDQRWKGRKETWTNDYLCKVAGESSVRVEYRDSKSGRFGQGRTNHENGRVRKP